MQNLVIVESPTKARTLSKFLGEKYRIEASMGHIRDLPKSELGVDVEKEFEPKYIIPRDKRKKANELQKIASQAQIVWLASDPDREGEAIAWHISELLRNFEVGKGKRKAESTEKKPEKIEFRRVVFHEITPEAIKEAFENPRNIDFKLVDAQQARRVLDRLVGYKLSPLLWEKVKKGLSAGRVQSVALRLIVEREKEIQAFVPVEYWSIIAELQSKRSANEPKFNAALIEINSQKAEVKNEAQATEIVTFLEAAIFEVAKIAKKEVRRFPSPPFTTSTLQQAASNKLGYSAKKTMSLAQNLYEHGLITYMRTDSVNLAASAVQQAREFILNVFGQSYLPNAVRVFKSKSKNAQEAHEAIRPTNANLKADDIKMGDLNKDHAKLYELIWKRFIACQMSEAVMDQTTIDIEAGKADSRDIYTLRATGSVIKFDGWLNLYGKKGDDSEEKDSNVILPELAETERLNMLQILPEQHFTEPPPRYNEASLIKKLEELGIGRPSTYAPTISTIQERYYVERKERRFFPTALGMTVIDFLMRYFPDIIDYTFTAAMEDELDEIARGERDWRPTLKSFYNPFSKKLEKTSQTAEKIPLELEKTDRICPVCGKPLVVRIGKFGKFLACSGFPECKHTEGLEERVDAKCPEDGGEIVIRKTRHGKTFYGCKNWPTCKFASWTKPKTGDRGQGTGDSEK